MKRFLIIQTASIGDVILTTPVLESLHKSFPGSEIDIMVKKGNEQLFGGHPFINLIYTWDKSRGKYRNLLRVIRTVRRKRYNYVINMQRFASTGIVTLFSRAEVKVGFDKNPFSWAFTRRVNHKIGEREGVHEVERNLGLIREIVPQSRPMVRLYPSAKDLEKVRAYKKSEYICIAPASLWFTKQFPGQKWVEFIRAIDKPVKVYLLGSGSDRELCERIVEGAQGGQVENLAGSLNLLETAALMKDAKMNFVNDSAPQHLASAVNAPVTAIFCSTVPAFGFGPLSDDSLVIETDKNLECRPCGLHGLEKCPEGHFECANSIDIERLKKRIL